MPGKPKASGGTDDRPLLPNFVRQWRKYRGYTQDDLAERSGLSIPTISLIERGRQDFSGKTLFALANALETSPAALVGSPPNAGDIWTVWEELGRQDRQPEAAAMLRALRDTPKR